MSSTKKERPPAKRRKEEYDPVEEKELEDLVFGAADNVFENLETEHVDFEVKARKTRTKVKDESEDSDEEELKDDDRDDVRIEEEIDSEKRKPAWFDEAEEDYSINKALNEQNRKLPGKRPENSYNELLEKKFTSIYGTPDWADLNKKVDHGDDSDEEILKHSGHIRVKESKKLKDGVIDIKNLKNLNHQTKSEGQFINSVEFHPTSMVALVGGSAGILSIFEVNGKDNNKLHSLQFEKFPICSAKFVKEGNEIIVSNLSAAHFFCYNLITGKTRKVLLPHNITSMRKFEVSPNGKMLAIKGKFGEIHILDGLTYELSFTLKMNNMCNVFAFTPDSKYLISHGDCPDMYIWELSSRRCINRPYDDGCISCSSIAISPSGQFVATGSKQGVVNIYDFTAVLEKKLPIPRKTVMNLVTAISDLKFNPQSEILAIISREMINAFKMVHIPSFHTFSNFPNFQTSLSKPLSVAFSPGSGYMAISNNEGHAFLYKLKHYGNY